jgi:hypothetical protein
MGVEFEYHLVELEEEEHILLETDKVKG